MAAFPFFICFFREMLYIQDKREQQKSLLGIQEIKQIGQDYRFI